MKINYKNACLWAQQNLQHVVFFEYISFLMKSLVYFLCFLFRIYKMSCLIIMCSYIRDSLTQAYNLQSKLFNFIYF